MFAVTLVFFFRLFRVFAWAPGAVLASVDARLHRLSVVLTA